MILVYILYLFFARWKIKEFEKIQVSNPIINGIATRTTLDINFVLFQGLNPHMLMMSQNHLGQHPHVEAIQIFWVRDQSIPLEGAITKPHGSTRHMQKLYCPIVAKGFRSFEVY